MAKIMIKLVVIITTSKDKIVRNGRMKAASTIRMMTLIVGIVNCDWSTVGSRGMSQSNSLIRINSNTILKKVKESRENRDQKQRFT